MARSDERLWTLLLDNEQSASADDEHGYEQAKASARRDREVTLHILTAADDGRRSDDA